jgi:ABC-type lipoprotein release transport system permease subunit
MIVGATFVISFLETLSPARRAARLDPVDVLRYE